MGKTTGFIEESRKEAGHRPVKERLKDYRDVMKCLPDDKIREQASRCMDCGVPFCHGIGCPLGNFIPEWNDLVYRGKWEDALRRLEETNPLPEITGRICPALCESACTLSINDSPVTIRQVELAVIEHGFEKGWVKPKKPEFLLNRKVAIVGSGPAGLSAAIVLRQKGYEVTVFEKSERLGGILRFGIPDFKLEKWIIDRRIKIMVESGIKFETGVNIGEDISVAFLKRSFDVVLLTVGAGEPRDMKVPGRELGGICFAMDYLQKSNESVSGVKKNIITAKDKNVLVIGGGDTGSDCVGTANRQGAKKVYLFEIMPKPQEWKESWNPQWPEWPLILRTSSSHEEGVKREWSVSNRRFRGRNKEVNEVDFIRIEWKRLKESKGLKVCEVPDSEFSLKVELVILAMGFVHVEHGKLLKDMGVRYDKKGNIQSNRSCATSVKGVFTAGDAAAGASLAVRAIKQGKEAAESIHEYLCKK